MSQNYRHDSRHSYNSRPYEYQRQSNRSSHNNNSSYKDQQSYRSHRRDDHNQESHGYKTKQYGQQRGDNFRSSPYHRQSSNGYYLNREHSGYNKYGKQQNDNYKEIQQRSYSRDMRTYKRYDERYDRNYDSRYEKRSRSRSKNRDDYGQQGKDYVKKSGFYESKNYHHSSNPGYIRQQKTFELPSQKTIEIDSRHKNQRDRSPKNMRDFNQKIQERNQIYSYKKYSREKYEDQNYQRKESKSYIKESQKYQTKQINQKREDQPKNFISIEVKSRQRSPNTKEKKSRKSHSSQSKSLSKSRRSKQNQKRKHNKKHRSISSSSHSSSYSSSSSSSSSNRSSSSSSSHSSSSSYSKSAESRRYKNKEHKDFYNKKQSYQKYSTSNYLNRERYDEKFHTKKPNEYPNALLQQSKDVSRKYDKTERQPSKKQIVVQKLITIQQKSSHELRKPYDADQKDMRESHIEIQQIQKVKVQKQGIFKDEKQSQSYKTKSFEPSTNLQKPFQQREPYRRYPPYNRVPYESQNQNYQNSRQFTDLTQNQQSNYNQSQQSFVNQNQIINQQSEISQSSFNNKVNADLNVPSYPNRIYSSQNPKVPYGTENDYQKRNLMNQTFRKPYVNAYQNYPPPPTGMFAENPYQKHMGNPPYQRYNQGFAHHRPYQKPFYQNKNYQAYQPNLSSVNNSNNPQAHFYNPNQIPYQSNFQPQMRRVSSQMVGQRKSSYFQTVPQNKQNQINKLQTEKQDLALIQQAFKRQSELKKIKQLIPCSKTLELIQKARQNLSIPAIKPNFLLLDLFKEMNDFKKQTMNPKLRSILQQNFQKKYNEQKSKVFQNLRLLDLDEKQINSNTQKIAQKQITEKSSNQNGQLKSTVKMDVQNNQNPEEVQRPNQFIFKRPQMSQNLRQLKSNIQMLRKASSSLSQLSRKMKIKEIIC